MTTTAHAVTYTPAPNAPSAAAVQNGQTPQAVRSLVNDRFGTKALADAATVQRGKVDFYALNEARAKAAQATATTVEKQVAKGVILRGIAANALPKAAALLGPVGWTVAAVSTGYTLCRTVFGCFTTKPTIAPPPAWSSFTARPGLTRIRLGDGGGISRDSMPTGSTTWNLGSVQGMTGATSNDPLYGWITALGEPGNSIEGIHYYSPAGSGSAYETANTPLVEPTTPGVRLVRAPGYTMNTGNQAYLGFYIAPLNDNIDVAKKDSCPSGETCGTLPEPTDSALGSGMWDAAIAANDLPLARHLAAQVEKDMEQPPPAKVTIPALGSGETATSYVGKLQALGLGFVRTVVSTAAADLTKPAGAVLDLSPAPNTSVDPASTVLIRENPDPLPVTVLAPAAHETYDAYVARLRAAGLTGTITRVDLSDVTLDAQRGPTEVVRTNPTTGTRTAPTTGITVYVNPDTAPTVGTDPTTGDGGGDGSGGGLKSINFDPLKKATPCNSFPFGVPCWVVGALGGFNAEGHPPNVAMALPFDQEVATDWSWWAPIAAIYKPVMLFVSYVFLAWGFMRLVLSGNDGDQT